MLIVVSTDLPRLSARNITLSQLFGYHLITSNDMLIWAYEIAFKSINQMEHCPLVSKGPQ